MFAQLPIFLFRLLTGRYSFLQEKSASRSVARAFMPEAESVQGAFEEVRQSKQAQQDRVAAKPDDGRSGAPIVVTIATDGSYKVDIPDFAFEPIDAGR